jgi:hypothetical protein
MTDRLLAVTELDLAAARELAGRHEYDGQIQDLSVDGVRRALATMEEAQKQGKLDDPHDEAHLAAFERRAEVVYGELELHRRNPLFHQSSLELSGYDRAYAPEADRRQARERHLASWPEAVDIAVQTLDQLPAPIAESCLNAVRGLAAGLDADRSDLEAKALQAHARFVDHVAKAAKEGPEDAALGGPALAKLLSSSEALDVDLSELSARADAERDRLRDILTEACARLLPGVPLADAVRQLNEDHPSADGVLAEATEQTAEVLAWTREHNLAPTEGECTVRPSPESYRWSIASLSPVAPYEPVSPTYYNITPPDAAWPAEEQEEWLQIFSRSTLPAITVHEVAPGHFSHFLSMRTLTSDVRKTLQGDAFIEGWAHYCEEMALQEGFRDGDARFAAGVAIEGLVRVTRLAMAIGLHTGALTVAEAAAQFTEHAFHAGPGALSEARRGTFDPTYGRYTWGKLEIMRLRDQARKSWGAEFSLPRFHRELLALGSPPLGLIPAILG